jgi:mannose-1-phosphate guanylyltransferase
MTLPRRPAVFADAGSRWAIVLAGGDGRRLAPVAERLYGYARPKQFCRFGSGRTLLEETVHRAALFTGAASRIVLSTSRHHRAEVAETMLACPGVWRVEQPRNLDTTPGILLPLLGVLSRDPDAIVLVLPSDHHVSDDLAFVASLVRPLGHLDARPDTVVMAGASMNTPEPDLGWIVRGRARGGWHDVASFTEKPDRETRERLHATGALANTFAFVGRGAAVARLARRHASPWWRALVRARRDGSDAVARVYEQLEPSSFSRDVLQKATPSLGVVALRNVVWSDVGTPERLAAARGVPLTQVARDHSNPLTRDAEAHRPLIPRSDGSDRGSPAAPARR